MNFSMRILYDYQAFIYQNWGGVSRYFSEIMTRLPPDCVPTVGLKVSTNIHAATFAGVTKPVGFFSDGNPFPDCIKKSRVYDKLRIAWLRSMNRRYFQSILAQKNFDLLHITLDFEDWWLPHLGDKPFVYTVHDLIPERYWQSPAYFQRRKNLAQRAARIIAVSENTKRDCIEYWGVPEAKIDVIYHAPSVQQDGPRRENAFGDYLLYVGTRNRQKNFTWFVSALAPLLRERPGLKLVCTGNPFSRHEQQLLRQLKIENQVIGHFFAESELFDLYRHARAFIYPSRYEGFGMPILDAFQAGCPVILTEASCFPEVGGDAALYFAPEDADSLRARVASVLDDPALRAAQIARGRARSARFTWEETAARTAEVYRRVKSCGKKTLKFETALERQASACPGE